MRRLPCCRAERIEIEGVAEDAKARRREPYTFMYHNFLLRCSQCMTGLSAHATAMRAAPLHCCRTAATPARF